MSYDWLCLLTLWLLETPDGAACNGDARAQFSGARILAVCRHHDVGPLVMKVGAVMVPAGQLVLIANSLSSYQQVFPLLSLALETHPLHARCDTSVDVDARPLEIVYDAVSMT